MPDDISEMRDSKIGCNRRNDQPGKKSANDPETFPTPVFYFFIRHVKTSGSKAAYKMENNAYDSIHILKCFRMEAIEIKIEVSGLLPIMYCHAPKYHI